MKIFYAAVISSFLVGSAMAQSPATQISGNGAFCVVMAGKADCKFADAQACEKEKTSQGAETKNATCVARGAVK